jgi:putative ABC transport system ATP-binding protein
MIKNGENMGETILSAKGVWKSYREGGREISVLRGVDIDVSEGEQIGIMGPSGSGKTTFLNVASGLDDATKGRIYVAGLDLTSMSISQKTEFRRKNVGFIFQSFNLVQSLTTLENVMLPLLMNGYSRSQAEKEAEALLKRVQLSSRKDAYPNLLSGGEKQRAAIARALIHHPKIIFADEPTGNLDRETSRSVIQLMFELNKEYNQTMLIVTHDPNVVKSCDRVYFLNGQLKELSKDEIKTLSR